MSTKKNVLDSEATVIIYFEQGSGGNEQALRHCLDEKKPHWSLDAREVCVGRRYNGLWNFIVDYQMGF